MSKRPKSKFNSKFKPMKLTTPGEHTAWQNGQEMGIQAGRLEMIGELSDVEASTIERIRATLGMNPDTQDRRSIRLKAHTERLKQMTNIMRDELEKMHRMLGLPADMFPLAVKTNRRRPSPAK